MTREDFERRYSPEWERLERAVKYSRDQKATTPLILSNPPDLTEYDRLYRTVCKHLALARMRLYGTDLIDRLNDLATQAQGILEMERGFNRAAGLDSSDDRLPEFFKEKRLATHDVVFDVSDEDLDRVLEF